MRIGHFAPKIGAPGGIATYIRRTGEAQQARGHEVFYFTEQRGGEGADHQILSRLNQRLNRDVGGYLVLLDEPTDKVIVRLACGWKTHLDFLETQLDQQRP